MRNSANATFRLDDLGDKIAFGHRAFTSDLGQYNVAAFKVVGGLYASVRQRPLGTTFSFLSNLNPGSLVSQGYFLPGSFFKTMAHSGNGPFVHPGIGFIGFAFNNDSGKQYGWARVQMAGGAPGGGHKNNFRVLDYAYADPGEPIQAGQTSDDPVTGMDSLGLLAAGAIGLQAWRRSRRSDEHGA